MEKIYLSDSAAKDRPLSMDLEMGLNLNKLTQLTMEKIINLCLELGINTFWIMLIF
jgi:hypothetical protein